MMALRSSRSAIALLVFVVSVGAWWSGLPAAQSAPGQPLAARIDALMAPVYKAGEPGAALLVAKGGTPIVRKAYGMADLELGVALEPDMVFRIGSMTKQFTAVAILMLMEQGKLGLDDPITKHLPDYPTHGRTITIEHLLTHTSGIPSYTGLPEWRPQVRKDMAIAEILALFKDKPLEFEPGERWRYNNSGYILLGAIIERVSGGSYEAFLRTQLFEPLGLRHTSYGSATRIIPRRVPGYEPAPSGGFRNAEYLSMTQPYAAGALLSTVDDIVAWNEALLDGRLIRREMLERAWTPYRLRDGTSSGYGYGWGIGQFMGHRLITHSGGIHGFASDGILYPEERLSVVLLTNSSVPARAPGRVVPRIGALALGKTYTDPPAVELAAETLAPLAGVYASAWKETLTVWVEGSRVDVAGPGMPRTTIRPLSRDVCFFPGSPSRVAFERDARGQATAAVLKPALGAETRFARTKEPLPSPRTATRVDPTVLDLYAGEYELQPGFIIRFFRQGDAFMTQATGQPAFEVFAESESRFFLKVVDAQVEFVRDASGAVTGIVLTQNGRSNPAKRVR